VNFPPPLAGRDRRIAYVEFGDEEAMKAGLDKHAEVCAVPSLFSQKILTPQSFRNLVMGSQKLNEPTTNSVVTVPSVEVEADVVSVVEDLLVVVSPPLD
jgi:hypothetical protein